MTESEIKFKAIQMLSGIKYLSKKQIDDFIGYAYHSLQIEKNEEHDRILMESIELYFKLKYE